MTNRRGLLELWSSHRRGLHSCYQTPRAGELRWEQFAHHSHRILILSQHGRCSWIPESFESLKELWPPRFHLPSTGWAQGEPNPRSKRTDGWMGTTLTMPVASPATLTAEGWEVYILRNLSSGLEEDQQQTFSWTRSGNSCCGLPAAGWTMGKEGWVTPLEEGQGMWLCGINELLGASAAWELTGTKILSYSTVTEMLLSSRRL